MGNTVLTPTAVTRKALAILHQKLNFVGNVNRTYDSSFAKTGAKIGDSLKIRLPNEFTIRSGASLSTQDVTETSTTLQVATQKGVDTTFSSSELTLSLDDFASRILEPAMSVLAANIEADALAMYKDVYNVYDQDATAFALSSMLGGRKILNDNLAPMDSNRTALLTTDAAVKFMTDTKGLFQDSAQIAKQYRDGVIGKTAGFDVYENTLLVPHTTGTSPKTTTYTVNGAITTNGTAAVTVATGTATFAIGDVFTVAGCFRVHPETKVSTGVLQQFVVTAAYAGGAGSLAFSPAVYTSGARQNVVAAGMANGNAIVKIAAGASETMTNNLLFHRDAFAFATADLLMPEGVDWSAREVYDGISLRIVRQYAISTDTFPCRIDVLYGYKTVRPQLAVRLHADG
jgi:hypothetical protein